MSGIMAAVLAGIAGAATAGPMAAEILRPPLARLAPEGTVTVATEPQRDRVLASPAVAWSIAPAERQPGQAFELTVQGTASAEIELTARYPQGIPFVLPRRAVEPGAPRVIRWEIPKSDEATSMTLAVRSSETTSTLTLLSARTLPLEGLGLAARLDAFTPRPLRPASSVTPLRNGALMVEFDFPEALRATLSRSRLVLELEAAAGKVRQPMNVALEPVRERGAIVPDLFTLEAPPGAKGRLTARVILRDGEREEILAQDSFEQAPAGLPFLEVPLRSTEEFAALERNGELVIYSCVGDPGLRRGSEPLPLPVESVWVSVGNGVEWVFTDPVLRTRRDVDWMAGGPLAFGAVLDGGVIHALFTTASDDGREVLNYAGATSSVRLAPVAKNPILDPGVVPADRAPLLRGNAVADFNGSRLVLQIVRTPDKAPEIRALVSNMKSRWNDLGSVPVPELPAGARWLSILHDGQAWWLLGGPEARLWRTDNPLRNWTPVPFEAPRSWDELQLVRWADGLWLFGIRRFNGSGAVVWAPLDRENETLRVRQNFTIQPAPPGKSLPSAPPPTPARAETDVR